MKSFYALYRCIGLLGLSTILLLISSNVFGQKTATVYGEVTDKSTGEPLPFATVSLDNTIKGVTTDVDGKYHFSNIPPGYHTLVYSFIGYKKVKEEVDLDEGEDLEINLSMDLDAISIQEVVVTGQALGQQAAINRQINANTIMNVVSQERIRELPDQNAAETVGRLPGIAVQRNAGEGQKVVVRGLSPRYTSITVNGERIPSTDNDRSVDLSMMSPDILSGIEVFKSLTPDRDADAIGGTVNFLTKRASSEGLEAQATAQYGYNHLANEWGQIRSSFSVGKRFFDNKLGFIMGGNFQKANRSQDVLSNQLGEGDIIEDRRVYTPEGITMNQEFEDRFRYGGSFTADYVFKPGHRVTVNSVLQYTDRDRDRYRISYSGNSGRVDYRYTAEESAKRLFSNIFSGEHKFDNGIELTYRGSYATTISDRPLSVQGRFWDQGGAESSANTHREIYEKSIAELHSLDGTLLTRMTNDTENTESISSTFQSDLEIPVQLNPRINGSLKLGGKIRFDTRTNDENNWWTRSYELATIDQIAVIPEGTYTTTESGLIQMYSFLSPFDGNGFRPADYTFGVALDTLTGYHLNGNAIRDFYNSYPDEFSRTARSDFNDYDATDVITAGYVMTNLNFFDKVTFVGGLRMENTALEYRGVIGSAADIDQENDVVQTDDTLRSRSYIEFFPQVNLKIQPFEWFDIRLAATRTLNRPNFLDLVPYSEVNNFGKSIRRGNFDLQHTTAWNYDAFLSFYNKVGLFTLGGFYKELTDINFNQTSQTQLGQGQDRQNYTLREPANAEGTGTVKGIEAELQMNFRFLPKPLDGILLGTNVSFINTTTFYPQFQVLRNPTRFLLSTIEGPMIGQAEFIFNVSLGYEKNGFTGRASLVRQGSTLKDVQAREEEYIYDAAFTRVDVTFKQKINDNLRLYVNLNNLTNQKDITQLQGFNTRVQEFGMTADFGIQVSL